MTEREYLQTLSGNKHIISSFAQTIMWLKTTGLLDETQHKELNDMHGTLTERLAYWKGNVQYDKEDAHGES